MKDTYRSFSSLFLATKAALLPNLIGIAAIYSKERFSDYSSEEYITNISGAIVILLVEVFFFFLTNSLNKVEVTYRENKINRDIRRLQLSLPSVDDPLKKKINAKIKSLKEERFSIQSR